MRKSFRNALNICFYLSVIQIAVILSIIPATIFNYESYYNLYFYNSTFYAIRSFLSLPALILWISMLILWSKFDKNIGRFFMLFFLIGIYSLFYYRRAERSGWFN